MLQTGLSHGVAIIPNAPKQRYSDPVTGAHFEFKDMCVRLDKILKKRFQEEMQASTTRKSINKDFLRESGTSNHNRAQTESEAVHDQASKSRV